MIAGLEIMVVDDHPETDRALAMHLVQRCRRVSNVVSVREALLTLERGRQAGDPFDLVFCDVAHLEADGLALLRELRRCQDGIPVVLAADYSSVNGIVEAETRRLGVLAIIDKPIDLDHVDALLGQVRPTRTPPPPVAPPAPPPMARPVTASYTAPPLATPAEALERLAPAPPRSAFPTPRPPAAVLPGQQGRAVLPLSGTSRIRRSVDLPTPPPATPPPPTGPYRTRFTPLPAAPPARRSLDPLGATPPPLPRGERRSVLCSRCGGSFLVQVQPGTTTTFCLHCGQTLRLTAS